MDLGRVNLLNVSFGCGHLAFFLAIVCFVVFSASHNQSHDSQLWVGKRPSPSESENL